MTKEIPLTQGRVAIIDDEDYGRVSAFQWHASKNRNTWYARTRYKNKAVLLHVFLMSPPPGMLVDHKDGDGLNCTRDNLRICKHFENIRNSKRPSRNKSGYKGVSPYFQSGRRSWRAVIYIKRHDAATNKQIFLGYFENAVDAAKAYDAAALKYFGEFARLNFPVS